MKLTSPSFEDNGIILKEYTCDGQNINPPLIFENIPENAKSLVLIMDDPDVPKNLKPDGIFDHWIVFNMSPETKGIAAGEIPTGICGANSAGAAKYTGPCPPDREHRYFFKLFALDKILGLKTGDSKNNVLEAIKGHIIAEAVLMGRYDRK